MPRAKIIADYEALKKELSRVFYEVKKGSLTPKQATACAYIAQIFLTAFERDNTGKGLESTPLGLFASEMRKRREERGIAQDSVG